MKMYRKPTTDLTIDNNTSCHPSKLATFKNWIQDLHKLPLNKANKNKGLNGIKNIAENNGYKKEKTTDLYNQTKEKKTQNRNKNG
jgi:hypothetical protein